MKKDCLVRAHKAGLFSLINNVITCLLRYERVFADWSNSIYATPPGYSDLFPMLFDYNPGYMEEPAGDVLDNYPDQWLTYKNAAKLYDNPDGPWRQKCNQAWMKLQVENTFVQRALGISGLMGERIAVMVRANSHAGEQTSDRSQTLEDYARVIDKVLKHGQDLFVMCGDEETLRWFSDRYKSTVSIARKRAATRDTDLYLTEPQTWDDASAVLVEVMVASMSECLIHPVSNMATAALYMNPKLQSIYLP